MRTHLATLRARVRDWPALHVDIALGGLIALWALIEGALVEGVSAGDSIAGAALVGVVGAAVALRRTMPLAAVTLAWTAACLTNLLPANLNDAGTGLFVGLLLVVYSMALLTYGRRLWIGIAVSELGAVIAVLTAPESATADLVFLTIIGVIAPVSAGQLLQSRLRLNRALREKAARLERERAARAGEAVEQERARIAGELHDVVAHALGAMTVQAAAARRLTPKDPDRASGAFEAIEGTGREALAELRRLLGVLRHADEDVALEPQPRLAHVADLVRRARAAGLPVDLAVEGAPAGAVPPGIDLTGYRVVQEALGEALRSGGAGHAEVIVRYTPSGVEIEVLDDGPRSSARRLLGMRERVRVYGGDLQAGPLRDGGHGVRARLPMEGPA